MGENHNWDDNLAKVAMALFGLIREFKVVLSILMLGGAITLGIMDVPGFKAIVDGFVDLLGAGVTGIGL